VRKLKGDPKAGTRIRDAKGRIGGGARVRSEAQEAMKVRRWLSSLLRTHSWLPAAAVLSAAAVFAAVSLLRLQLFWLLGAGAAFGVSSFVCGYSAHKRRGINFPLLGQLHRRRYAEA
jgi:hypothetical protein